MSADLHSPPSGVPTPSLSFPSLPPISFSYQSSRLLWLLLPVLIWAVRAGYVALDKQRRYRALGVGLPNPPPGHKPVFRPMRFNPTLPFGIDFIWSAISAASVGRSYEFWRVQFESVRQAEERTPGRDRPMNPSSLKAVYGNSAYQVPPLENPKAHACEGPGETHNDLPPIATGSTIEASIGLEHMIVTTVPENIRAVLATQFQHFGKGVDGSSTKASSFGAFWTPLLGPSSIFTADGPAWAAARQILRPMFDRPRLEADLPVFEKHIQHLFSRIDRYGKPGDPVYVDIADLFFRFTLDSATEILLGQSVDSLSEPDDSKNAGNTFGDAFAEAQRIVSILIRMGRFYKLYPGHQKLIGAVAEMDKLVMPFVDRAVQLSSTNQDDKDDDANAFIEALAKHSSDRAVLRDHIVSVLLAGRDTTACTLSWMFHELSLRSDLVDQLWEEIVNTVGPTECPTYDQLKGMTLLQNTINETLRLYPVVPFNVRTALRDTTLPRGGGPNGEFPIAVLRGTVVVYSPLVVQRRADLFPDPSPDFSPVETFDPSRWGKQVPAKKGAAVCPFAGDQSAPETKRWFPAPWTYFPFNGGPRICLGQQFALIEMAYVTVRLLQRYGAIADRMGGRKPKMLTDLVLAPKEGVKVILFPRKESVP